MSTLFLSYVENVHETALSLNIGTKSGPGRDHVGIKSGLSGDQVGVQSSTQLVTQSPIQLHKTSFSEHLIKSVIIQVTEHVASTNHREHRGHRDFAAEVESTAKVTADVTTYPRGSNP